MPSGTVKQISPRATVEEVMTPMSMLSCLLRAEIKTQSPFLYALSIIFYSQPGTEAHRRRTDNGQRCFIPGTCLTLYTQAAVLCVTCHQGKVNQETAAGSQNTHNAIPMCTLSPVKSSPSHGPIHTWGIKASSLRTNSHGRKTASRQELFQFNMCVCIHICIHALTHTHNLLRQGLTL